MRGTVRIASSEAERQDIYRLRYEIYIEEMGGGQRHSEADVGARQFYDDWDAQAHHFYVSQDGGMVGCARLLFRRHGPFECEAQFELGRFVPAFPDQLSMSSRMAVHPGLRGSHLLKHLACAMFTFARDHAIRFDFIDCHPRLLPLYSRLGYRIYRPGFNHPKYTYVIPMVLVLDDCDYLERIRSPFASIAQAYPRSSEGTTLLLTRFPKFATDVQSAVCDVDEFWDLLKHHLLTLSSGRRPCDILSGLTEDEMKTVTSVGHLVPCREGDVVLSVTDPSRELFVILSGRFQVTGTIQGPLGEVRIVKELVSGESFGEIRFLTEHIRYATVTAVEDSRLLVLSAKALDRLTMTEPVAAAKLYRNLARLVANRLQDMAV